MVGASLQNKSGDLQPSLDRAGGQIRQGSAAGSGSINLQQHLQVDSGRRDAQYLCGQGADYVNTFCLHLHCVSIQYMCASWSRVGPLNSLMMAFKHI